MFCFCFLFIWLKIQAFQIFCSGVVKPKLTFSHGIFEIILIIFLLVALRNCWYLIKNDQNQNLG